MHEDDDPDGRPQTPDDGRFARMQGDIPPELAAMLEAQRQQFAEAREMNVLSMGMQAAGLHECFVSLVGAGFTESQALYYMAKATPGL
jgi:hypothetical protein